MEEEYGIQEILQKAIQPAYFKHYYDWHKTSNDKERKGLKLIGLIIKNKGMLRLKIDSPGNEFTSKSKSNLKSKVIE